MEKKSRGPDCPVYWPSSLPWPLVRNGTELWIVAELQTLAPIYIMSDGTKVRGEIPKWAREYPDPSKKRPTSKSGKRRKAARSFV